MTDAGLRTAGFVVLATLMRPVGGALSDQIGGARVLSGVFAGLIPFALLLMWPSMIPFTVGALGSAALLGLGNGAVFKLVPQYFPASTATVTGLVGAIGGLGGFFPPLLLDSFAIVSAQHGRGLAYSDSHHSVSGCSINAHLWRVRLLQSAPWNVRFPTVPNSSALPRGRRWLRVCWWRQSWSARAIFRTSIPPL